jgi:ABC-2 type transport system ATP-binding protein
LRYRPSRTRIGDVFAAVQAAGFTIRDVSSEESDLEEVFLRLTTGASGVRR